MKFKKTKIVAISLIGFLGFSLFGCDNGPGDPVDLTTNQSESWDLGENKVYFERRLWNKVSAEQVLSESPENKWTYSKSVFPSYSSDGTIYFDKNDDSITSEKFSTNEVLSVELTWSLNGGLDTVPTNVKKGEISFAIEALDENQNILSYVKLDERDQFPESGKIVKSVFKLNKNKARVCYIRLKLYQSYYKNFRMMNVGVGRIKVFSGENTKTTLPDGVTDNYVSTVTYTNYNSDVAPDARTSKGITLPDLRNSAQDLTTNGNQKILVVPCRFENTEENYFDFLQEGLGFDGVRKVIEECYFGAEGTNGWESLSSYYWKSSYNRLNIQGKVTPWYTIPYTPEEFYALSDGTASVYNLIDDVAQWYKENFDDYEEFDQNNDGYFDCISMIYTQRNCGSSETGVCNKNRYPKAQELYWAFTWKRSGVKSVEGWPKPFTFCWISFDQLFNTYNPEYTKDGKLLGDAHTIIHESGHALGLLDYYATGYNGGTPAGRVDMMDNNIGDHCAYSKWQYNWIAPKEQIIYDDRDNESKERTRRYEITLRPFESSGDFVIVPAYKASSLLEGEDPGKLDSSFAEYLTIEYYTPTGLNYQDTLNYYESAAGAMGIKEAGIKMFHIDSRLAYLSMDSSTGNYNLDGYLDVNSNKSEVLNSSTDSNITVNFPHHNDPTESNYDGHYLVRGVYANENNESAALLTGHMFNSADLFGSTSSGVNNYGITNHQNFVFNNGYKNCFTMEISNMSATSITLVFNYVAPAA